MKKGLSSIIIIILILLITVSVIYVSFNWLLPSSEQTQEEVGKSLINKNGCLLIENINTNNKKITLRNCGNNDLSNFVVYIDSTPFIQYSGKISAGSTGSIDYTEDITGGIHEISVSSNYANSPKITFNTVGGMCDVYIIQSMIPYMITDSNKYYCIAENIHIDDNNAINFSSVVQNTTLDCQDYNLDSNDATSNIGVYLETKTQNITINNCYITDFGKGIYVYDSNHTTIINTNINSSYGDGLSLIYTYNNSINNLTSTYNGGVGLYISEIHYSNLTNIIINYNSQGLSFDFSTNSYNRMINITANNNYWKGIYIEDADNSNVFTNITANNNSDGFFIDLSDNNNFTNITANNNSGYGLYSYSHNNNFTNIISHNNSWGFYLYGGGLEQNNSISGGSIRDNREYDYEVEGIGSTHNFTETNFTGERKIRFRGSSNPWFNYRNSTSNNIWLRTNVSTTTNITRKLTNFTNVSMIWNDTADVAITARYNITGLIPNTNYYAYNNGGSILGSPFNSGSNGIITFTTSLPAASEREIKVNTGCDYYISNPDYTIDQSNRIYCLSNDISVSSPISQPIGVIEFSSGVQNTTLDCKNYKIDGNLWRSYGVNINRTTNKNNTINNCYIEDVTDGIKLTNNSFNKILNNTASNLDGSGINLVNSSNNTISNNTANGNYDNGILLTNSKNNTINNNIFNNDYYGIWLDTSSNNVIANNIANGNMDDGIWLYSSSNSNILTNNTANYNGDEGITISGSNSNILTNNTAVENTVVGFTIYNSASGNIFTNNTANNNGDYGFLILSNSNTLINNIARNNSNGMYISSSSTNITGGSIFNNTYDYYFYSAGTTNNFTDTNFTSSRKIYFYDTISWFNYRNSTSNNIWLRTNASAQSTITRKLTNISQTLIQFNDTSSVVITARYNITGLIPNTNYNVYNNSVAITGSPFNSSSNGVINFTINLPAGSERMIKVNNTTSSTPSTPILWFKFNEANGTKTYDSSGNGFVGNFVGETFNNGRLGGASCSPGSGFCPIWTTGWFGNALDFDGGGDYVNVSDDSSLDINDTFTITAWIKPNSYGPNGGGRIVNKYNSSSGFGYMFYVYNSSANERELHFYGRGGTFNVGSTDGIIKMNEWQHVAVTYNTTRIVFYWNGTPQGGTGITNYTGTNDVGLFIGNSSYSSREFDGIIDEVRIWNRSLNQTEIQNEMNSYVPIERPLASWKFEEGSSTYANDSHVWVNGTYGSSLSFDGNDAVDVTNIPNSSLTVMAWIYPTQVDGDQRAIASVWGSGSEWLFRIFNDSSLPYRLQLAITNTSSSNNYEDSYSNKIINLNQWAHVAVTYDIQTKQVKFYKNATPEGSDTLVGNMRDSTDILRIGAQTTGSFDFFIGKIDEVKIWNRVLTQAEIQTEMSTP